MSFSQEVKNQILQNKFEADCCKISALSAYVRTNGSIITKSGQVGFVLSCENSDTLIYFSNIAERIFGEIPKTLVEKTTGKSRYKAEFISKNTLRLLTELGILNVNVEDLEIISDVDKYVTENECCKKAYVIGAFLGSGSVTVPEKKNSSTGYHLEFVFSMYNTATQFSELLGEFDFTPRLIERNSAFVVYLNGAGEVADMLGFLGANKACLFVNELIVEREVKNNTNRVINCEISNMTKQINASIEQRNAIENLIKAIGEENLPVQLKVVCKTRLNNPEDTLTELAEKLNISKSCLNHRLRKIMELSKNISS